MHYYQFHIADYRKDTAHLSPIEHYIYRTLIDLYHMDEAPITTDKRRCLRLLTLNEKDHGDSLDNVLADFFTLTDEGWRHSRVDANIAEYHANADKNRENGKKGGRPRKNPVGSQSVSSENPVGTQSQPTGNPNERQPITNNQKPVNQEPLTNNQGKDQDTMSGKPATPAKNPHDAEARQIVEYLNAKAGTSHRHCKGTTTLISARIKEGATVDEIKRVIDMKCEEWLKDPKMVKHLVPGTLFRASKYSNYAGMLSIETPEQRAEREHKEMLEEDWSSNGNVFANIGRDPLNGSAVIEGEVVRD